VWPLGKNVLDHWERRPLIEVKMYGDGDEKFKWEEEPRVNTGLRQTAKIADLDSIMP
jgi:hypothetical protein